MPWGHLQRIHLETTVVMKNDAIDKHIVPTLPDSTAARVRSLKKEPQVSRLGSEEGDVSDAADPLEDTDSSVRAFLLLLPALTLPYIFLPRPLERSPLRLSRKKVASKQL